MKNSDIILTIGILIGMAAIGEVALKWRQQLLIEETVKSARIELEKASEDMKRQALINSIESKERLKTDQINKEYDNSMKLELERQKSIKGCTITTSNCSCFDSMAKKVKTTQAECEYFTHNKIF